MGGSSKRLNKRLKNALKIGYVLVYGMVTVDRFRPIGFMVLIHPPSVNKRETQQGPWMRPKPQQHGAAQLRILGPNLPPDLPGRWADRNANRSGYPWPQMYNGALPATLPRGPNLCMCGACPPSSWLRGESQLRQEICQGG